MNIVFNSRWGNLIFVDLNGDHVSDLVAKRHGSHALAFFEGSNSSHFVEWTGIKNPFLEIVIPQNDPLFFDVDGDGKTISNKRVHIEAGPGGTPDGMRCDIDGNLWCGWGMGAPELDGVLVVAPDGERIGFIHLPERCANVCFGGPKRNRLFMAASQSLYSVYVNTQGVAGG